MKKSGMDLRFAARQIGSIALGMGIGLGMLAPVSAADWKPTQEPKVVLGFAAGGGADILCRILAIGLEPIFGKPLIVENRAGANGFIAADQAARSKPDGHTMAFVTMSMMTVAPYVPGNKLPIDVDKALLPVATLADIPIIAITHTQAPFNDIAALIARAKAQPGKLNYGSAGVASIGHLSGELFNSLAGTDLQHVSYKGGAQAMVDLIAGRIDLMIGNMPDFMGAIADRRLKPLAFAGTRGKPQLPDLPLVSASLPGFVAQNWFALMAPAGTDAAVISAWSGAIQKVLAQPDIQERLAKAGFDPLSGQTAELQRLIADDRKRWQRVISESKITMN
jgi:tripartite-type tricarboxylate transporter receptor subunit TctC